MRKYEEADPNEHEYDSSGPDKMKQFCVLDVDTRLFGTLGGQDFKKAKAIPFTKLKSVQNISSAMS